MDKKVALTRHKQRLEELTNTQARNLMEHAANRTKLLPMDRLHYAFVDSAGRC